MPGVFQQTKKQGKCENFISGLFIKNQFIKLGQI